MGMFTDIVGAVAPSLVSGFFSSQAAGDYADSIKDAQGISAEAAAQARKDIFDAFGPSYQVLQDAVNQSIDTLTTGRDSTASILQNASQEASNIINQTSMNAQRAYLGYPTQPIQTGGQTMAGPEAALMQNIRTGATLAVPGGITDRAYADPTQQGIADIYRSELGRDPEAAGLSYWSEQATAQGWTPEQTKQAILNAAPEWQRVQQPQPQVTPGAGYGYSQARQDLTQAQDVASQQMAGGVQGALSQTLPWYATGLAAQQREGALTGALGPQAQAQAFEQYQASPGQKWLRGQQEQALLRNQAAIGGLGGGNVRTALQTQAANIAAQNYQQDLANLSNLSARGLGAATGQAGYLAGLGQNLGALTAGTGAQLSNLASQAGRDIAGMIQGTGAQQTTQATNLGSALANLEQTTGINVANLIANLGQQQSGQISNLGQVLANLALGQGSTQAGLAQSLGQAQAAGQLGIGSALGQGIGDLAFLLGTQ